MKHVVYEEWQADSGRWYCGAITLFGSIGTKWWVPARVLDLPLNKYIDLLESYGAIIESYNPDTDYLHFYWDNYADAHRFVVWVNKQGIMV